MALSNTLNNNYIDIDIGFNRNPVTGDVVVRKDIEAIKRSLRNLLLFKGHEKPFHPEINSGIHSMLFEFMDNITVSEMKNKLENMIVNYEPRINNAKIDVYMVDETNEIAIVILFTVHNSPTVNSTTIMLERLR